jgi:hypothetical protein
VGAVVGGVQMRRSKFNIVVKFSGSIFTHP